jgi:hypothetical protein
LDSKEAGVAAAAADSVVGDAAAPAVVAAAAVGDAVGGYFAWPVPAVAAWDA